MAAEDKVNVNLNQNLWCLIVGFAALGAAVRWGLHHLFWPAYLFTWGTGVMVFISCVFYTWHYCVRKCVQTRSVWRGKPKLDGKSAAPGESDVKLGLNWLPDVSLYSQ